MDSPVPTNCLSNVSFVRFRFRGPRSSCTAVTEHLIFVFQQSIFHHIWMNWNAPVTFIWAAKQRCRRQCGHQFRRALSITQFPLPAEDSNKIMNEKNSDFEMWSDSISTHRCKYKQLLFAHFSWKNRSIRHSIWHHNVCRSYDRHTHNTVASMPTESSRWIDYYCSWLRSSELFLFCSISSTRTKN